MYSCVLFGYVVLAVAQAWPLPLHMGTHLTGNPMGDTGVYVWNLWIFSHELLVNGSMPLHTLEILPLAGPTDLSLHNYTVFSDLLAMPLQGGLGIVRTFNVVYLINAALAGLGMFLLARRLTGRAAESFLAGLMFAWAPFLTTRGDGHFSLAAAAPLPVFMLMLYRAWDSRRLRDAALAGVVLVWAAFCDPYYAVYCLMLGAGFVGSRMVGVSLIRRPAHDFRVTKQLIHVAIAAIVALVAGVRVLGDGELRVGELRIPMHTVYTPMLVLTALVLARIAVATKLRVTARHVASRRFVLRATLACGLAAGLLLSPTLYAVGRRAMEHGMPNEPVLWRSSAPGVDLLAFLAPNPNHPLAPNAIRTFLSKGAGGYGEQVASLSWIGALVIVGAWRFARFRPGRLWPWITVGFGLLSIGPFLQIAGVNTQIPGPWAVLRYAPLIGSARMPGRMSIVVMMGFCVLFATALAAIGQRYPARRRLVLSVVALLLVAELWPAPRTLFSAEVPAVFAIIAADPRPVRVLELPTGIRDGLSSIGNFSPDAQFRQTFHGKGLIGGYLSRVSPAAKILYRTTPVTSALMDAGEGRTLDPGQIDRAMADAAEFVRATNLGYVVMGRTRVSDGLRDFATTLFGLTKIAEADGYELYVPRR